MLKGLTFTSVPKETRSPVQIRRGRLIDRLEEQKALAKDPSYVKSTRKWVKKDGERVLIEKKGPVRPWWKKDEKGQVVLSVLQGYKPIEFEKGKGGIVVGSPDRLAAVIDAVVAAVRAGELDAHLETPKNANPDRGSSGNSLLKNTIKN